MPKRTAKKAEKRPAKPRATSVRRSPSRLSEQLAAVKAIGEVLAQTVGVDQLLIQVVDQVTRLMHAERSTLFLYDAEHEEIWSKVAEGTDLREIRLSRGQGVAGWVAEHRTAVNVPDAYADARFNPAVDKRTGFRTRSIVAAPLLDPTGRLLGVVQVLNRHGGPFGLADQQLLTAIASQIAFAVENARLSDELLRRNRELDLLYALEQEASASTDAQELLASILGRTSAQLRSAEAAVLLTQGAAGIIYRRTPSGLTPESAKADDPLVRIADGGTTDHDRRSLRVPLVWDRRIIGALEVSGPERTYDSEDLKTLTLVAGQLSRALTVTQERAERTHNDRLAVIGRMLASVAHDLRTPMTVISGHAQLMTDEADAAKRIERSNRILVQIDEMTAMVGDLLAFARGDSKLHIAYVSIEPLALELRDTLRPVCEPRGIQLRVEHRPGVAFVDPGRVKRILHNLAKNAIDVTSRGDSLTIGIFATDQALELFVQDEGIGMDAETRARLFEPFFTGKAGGTGLGLTIVKRFVEDHRGRITVSSAPGRGTRIDVVLPHVRGPEMDTSKTENAT
jgi:signal transduction histidine kinase